MVIGNDITSDPKDDTSVKQNYFGETLRELRTKDSLTQGQAALKVGWNQAQWSSYETGKTRPDLDILIHIAKHFNLKPLAIAAHSFDNLAFANDRDSALSLDFYQNLAEVTVEEARATELEKKYEEFMKRAEEIKLKIRVARRA